MVQDAHATIKEHLFDPTMLSIGSLTHPRDWDLKNLTSIFEHSLTKNVNSCLIWPKLTIMTKDPSRRIFEVESKGVPLKESEISCGLVSPGQCLLKKKILAGKSAGNGPVWP